MCHCVAPNVKPVRQWSAAYACVNRRWESVGRGIVVDDLETLNPRPHQFHLAPLLEKESSSEPVNDDTAIAVVHVGIQRAARIRPRFHVFSRDASRRVMAALSGNCQWSLESLF